MKHLCPFESFLNESKQVGTIYHFTTLDALESILDTDRMESHLFDYISFSRNPNLNFHNRHVRISLDGNRMSQKFHIEPFMYDEDKDPMFASDNGPRMSQIERRKMYGDEREERITANEITGIKKYIIRIDVKDGSDLKPFEREKNLDERISSLKKKYPFIQINVMKPNVKIAA